MFKSSPIIKCKPLRHVSQRCYSLCYAVINTHGYTQTHILALNIDGRKKELRILPVNIVFLKSSKKKKNTIKTTFSSIWLHVCFWESIKIANASGFWFKRLLGEVCFHSFWSDTRQNYLQKMTSQRLQRKEHCTAFLKHILCSTILAWMVALETNTAQLGIEPPVSLSSLWWEKLRTALGPGGRRTTGKGADVCGEEQQSPASPKLISSRHLLLDDWQVLPKQMPALHTRTTYATLCLFL